MLAFPVRLCVRRLTPRPLLQSRFSSSKKYSGTEDQAIKLRVAPAVVSVAFAGVAGWWFHYTSTGVERTESKPPSQTEEEDDASFMAHFNWRSKATVYILETASAVLRLNEMERDGLIGSGVYRTYGVRHSSHALIEDQYASGSVQLAHGDWWSYWGVFDGHA